MRLGSEKWYLKMNPFIFVSFNLHRPFRLLFHLFNLLFSMSVTKEDVLYVAGLARLRLSNEETTQLAADMNQILSYMELLNQVDTTDVEPLEHVMGHEPELRADVALPPLPHEEALRNAPDADADHFRVPKVIE